MKKTAIAAGLLLAVSPLAAFAANKVELYSTSNGNVATNSKSYLVLSVFDSNGNGVEKPKLLVKQTPSYLLDVSDFVACSSAEGQELCPKADESLAGLKGAFVATVQSKEKEGTAKIDVYVDQVPSTVQVKVGSSVQPSEAAAAAPAKQEPSKAAAATPVEDVKAGGHANGILLLVLALFALGGAAFANSKKA